MNIENMEIETMNVEYVRYVTYDPETGYLTGSYFQVIPAAHMGIYIVATEEQASNWTSYQANAARDGLEVAPPRVQPVVVPEVVDMLNAELALIDAGLLAAVETYVASLSGPDGDVVRAYWRRAQTMRRDIQWVEEFRVAAGLSTVEIDNLFINAATYP